MLTAGTSLEGSPAFAFSAVTGQGLDEIRAHIIETLQRADKPEARGYFRLPVDRVFVLQGHGLVVTGTALSGQIASGDHVRCLPGDQTYRVRSLQVHNEPVDTATRGQRIALNLSGQEKPAIARGDVICQEKLTRTTDRLDALLEVRPMAAKGVKNHQRVRVHLGTAERLAKVILLEPREKVGPKESCYCQIALVEPLLALRRDRFIIRDETAQRTLGGGVVLHPWARTHKRKEPGLQEHLALLRTGEPIDLVGHFIDTSDEFAVPIAPIYQFLNLREEDVRQLLADAKGVRAIDLEGEQVYTTQGKWQKLSGALLATLGDFHASHPLAPGMEMEAARDKLPSQIPSRLFRAFVERLETTKTVARDGSLLRLPGHTVRLRDDEQQLAERVRTLLGHTPLAPPDLKEVEREVGVARAKLTEVIRVMEREHSIVRVSGDLYFLAEGIDTVKTGLYKHLTEKNDITPAAFRELFGTSRKYTIPLLEYFDREGITVRVGDARRLKSQR
jgi:selenocysteine-specific elongation factor